MQVHGIQPQTKQHADCATTMAKNNLLRECFRMTRDFRAHWKELGLLLKIEKYCLEEIQKNNPRDVAECTMDMLEAWINSNTYEESDCKSRLDAALDELHRTVYTEENCEERVKLDHNIEERIDALKADFADIAVEALRWLDDKYPKAKDAARWVNEILKDHNSEQLVVPSSSVSNDGKLSDQLSLKWSFTNYIVLEGIIKKIGIEKLAQRMKKYKETFKSIRRSISISGQKVTFETFDPNKKCLILILEDITDFDDIELFLRGVFDIYTRYFRIHKIETGCIKVTLQFDASVERQIQACIEKKCEEMKHSAKMYIESDDITELKTYSTPTSDNPELKECQDNFNLSKSKMPNGEMFRACSCLTMCSCT